MPEEIWEDIKDYEGLYQVSNFGRVKSLKREWTLGNHNGKMKHDEMILKPRVALGYIHATLRKNNKAKTFKVHRLVLQAFKGESNLDCNHKDGVKSNNYLENLEYCTDSENKKHAYAIGLQSPMRGEKNPASKLNNDIVKNIRENKYNLTSAEFAACYDIEVSAIRRIKANKSWNHV